MLHQLERELDRIPFHRIDDLLEYHRERKAVVLHTERHLQLWDDRANVLRAVKTCPAAIKFADSHWHNDAEVMLAACTRDGSLLACASEALRADKELVFMAVGRKVTKRRSQSRHAQNQLQSYLYLSMFRLRSVLNNFTAHA